MSRKGSRQQASAAFLLRRLSTSNDHARRRATLDNHLVGQSPLRDAGSAYRNRPTGSVTRSIASKTRVQGLVNTPPAPKSP
jgi:hypothetical protein